MLRAIPSSALACCVDGVTIPASAMQAAQTATRLGDYARRRAAAIVSQGRLEADDLRRRATEDAYRETRVQGAKMLLGVINDLGQLRSALLEGVMAQARQQLREHCAAAGFTAAWVEQACQVATGNLPVVSRIQIPQGDDSILLALRETLGDTVTIEQVDVPCLRIEQGDLVLEYDPEHVVFDAASQPPLPDMHALHDGMAAIASRYADAIVGPRSSPP